MAVCGREENNKNIEICFQHRSIKLHLIGSCRIMLLEKPAYFYLFPPVLLLSPILFIWAFFSKDWIAIWPSEMDLTPVFPSFLRQSKNPSLHFTRYLKLGLFSETICCMFDPFFIPPLNAKKIKSKFLILKFVSKKKKTSTVTDDRSVSKLSLTSYTHSGVS